MCNSSVSCSPSYPRRCYEVGCEYYYPRYSYRSYSPIRCASPVRVRCSSPVKIRCASPIRCDPCYPRPSVCDVVCYDRYYDCGYSTVYDPIYYPYTRPYSSFWYSTPYYSYPSRCCYY